MPRFQRRYRLCRRWWVYYTINAGHARRKQHRAASCQPYLNIVAIIFLFFLLLLCCNNDKVPWRAAAYRESKISVGCVSSVGGPYASLCSVDLSYFCSRNAPHKKLPAPIGSIVELITFGNVCIHVPTTKIPFCSFTEAFAHRIQYKALLYGVVFTLEVYTHSMLESVCVSCLWGLKTRSEDLPLLLLQNAIFFYLV